MKCLLSLFIIALFIHYGQSYKAAIVEHSPVTGATPTETIQKNLEIYRSFIEKTLNKGADIIVFPEYGLTTLVVSPDEYAIDFSNDNIRVLQILGALAAEHSIYLVVNLLEQVKETTKIKYYNTNLIYNRNGTIIAKYRKINLFNEPNLTPGNEVVTFKTDFGVTFGVLTCFDILYYYPSRTILENVEVTDIVYPLAWFSTMPFYTALTVQQGYFASHKINLLATNYNQPKEGHGGSGIYISAGGVADLYIRDATNSTLLIQDIPSQKSHGTGSRCGSKTHLRQSARTGPTDMTNYLTYTDFKAADYAFQNIDLSQRHTTTDVCYGQFCCNFKFGVVNPNFEETYKLMAYDGKVIFDRSYVHIRVCSLLACQNSTNESCGARINGTTEFTRIAVEGTMSKDNTTFYTPLTLSYGLLPILDTTYCDSTTGHTSNIKLHTNSAQKGILVFGIFGKNDSLIL